MKKAQAPYTLEDHINSLTDRVSRVERRFKSFEFYVQPEPPEQAGYGAFWLDTDANAG